MLCHVPESFKITVTLKTVIDSGMYDKSIYSHSRENPVKMMLEILFKQSYLKNCYVCTAAETHGSYYYMPQSKIQSKNFLFWQERASFIDNFMIS